MCGIAGVVSARPIQFDGRRMLDLQRHRGPDGEGQWQRPAQAGSPSVWLGHRRLAIIDLSAAAAQPMSSADGVLHLTYNGEIYNYVELMSELEARGRRFRSRSDSEVILHAYAEWGPACVDRLNGMFAFAIWDERRRELFAARDRFGEKPFHYAWNPATGFFAFASEIKALLAVSRIDAALDDRALYRFIAFHELAASDQTLWKGVRRLPRASWLRLSCTTGEPVLQISRYWDVDLDSVADVDPEAAAKHFADLFADSVRLRLRSDVAVGTSLSGGLDSSAIVCQIHALGAAAGQKTFSARMRDAALDEGRHIDVVRRQTGVEGHDVWPAADDLRALFPRLCRHLEEPFISTSQFAQHLVMRLASENGVTVLLDGQGADELLAGYSPYFTVRYRDLAANRRVTALCREAVQFRRRHGRRFPISLRAAAALMMGPARRTGRPQPPAAMAVPWGDMASCWNADWLAVFASESAPGLPDGRRDLLTRRLYADAFNGELQELLRYGDRNSMAWSREVRQPFLDHRLAEFLFALPIDQKIHNGETKVIMRRGLRHLLPPAIRTRQDKLGYQAPLAAWLSHDLRTWAVERLEDALPHLRPMLTSTAVSVLRHAAVVDERQASAMFSLLSLGECLAQAAQVGAVAA